MFYKHCCQSLLLEEHTDHCLSREAEIAHLAKLLTIAERRVARLRAQVENLKTQGG